MGHTHSNELLESPLASKLSDPRPLELFLGETLKNAKIEVDWCTALKITGEKHFLYQRLQELLFST